MPRWSGSRGKGTKGWGTGCSVPCVLNQAPCFYSHMLLPFRKTAPSPKPSWASVDMGSLALELGRHLHFNWLRFLKCSKNVLKFLIHPCWFSSFYVCVRMRGHAERVDEHTCILMCLHSYSCALIPTHVRSCVPLPMCLENKRV